MRVSRRVIVFLGPPGSGKGTQAGRLSSILGIPAISTGEMLRQECRSGSALGEVIQNVLDSGQLVSDDLVNQVVAVRLKEADCEDGCILDGYPRTLLQARFLDRLLASRKLGAPIVIDFAISSEEIVARLGRRRLCERCGRIFSVSAEENAFCEQDGARLIHRADDRPATIRGRLNLYEQNARELVHYYSGRNYHRICATRTLEEVSQELVSLVGGFRTHPLRGRAAPARAARIYQPQSA